MTTKFKIDFQSGTIKYEGNKEDLAEILKTVKSFSDDVNFGKSLNRKNAPETSDNNSTGKSTSKKSPKRKASSNRNSNSDTKNIDFKSIANKIKGSQDFEKIRVNFILKDKDYLNKAKLVLLYSEEALTTGDIERVYKEMGVRVPLPSISKAMSTTKSQFFTTDDTPTRYSMTAPTKSGFEEYFEKLGSSDD